MNYSANHIALPVENLNYKWKKVIPFINELWMFEVIILIEYLQQPNHKWLWKEAESVWSHKTQPARVASGGNALRVFHLNLTRRVHGQKLNPFISTHIPARVVNSLITSAKITSSSFVGSLVHTYVFVLSAATSQQSLSFAFTWRS